MNQSALLGCGSEGRERALGRRVVCATGYVNRWSWQPRAWSEVERRASQGLRPGCTMLTACTKHGGHPVEGRPAREGPEGTQREIGRAGARAGLEWGF